MDNYLITLTTRQEISQFWILVQLKMSSQLEQPKQTPALKLSQPSQAVDRRLIIELSQTCVDLAIQFTLLRALAHRAMQRAKFLRNLGPVWQLQQLQVLRHYCDKLSLTASIRFTQV